MATRHATKCVCVCVCRAAPVADDSITFLTAVNTAAKLTFIVLSSSLTWRHHDTSGDFTAVLQRESPNLSVSRVITAFTPGQHVSRQHVSRTSNLYPDTYMLADTCCRIQVARSGYMLTVSRQHNYYSFISRSTCIPLYPATDGQQTGNNCRHKKHVDGDRTHVADNLLPGNTYPGVNAALD